ncbi:MAG: hypothetical protein JO222_13130 [Frankiales bacterium]|nr:hypothetical protein [Frankiales bacterium]
MTVFFVILLVVVVGGAIWQLSTPEGRAKAEQHAAERRERRASRPRATRSTPISSAGKVDGGGLACPRCGGTQFKARRSTKARAGIVMTGAVGAVATRQTQVTCVTCGTRWKRG